MKHAILILAYNEPEHLKRLISYFKKDCYVFVHLDKKAKFNDEYVNELYSFSQVTKVYRKYSVHWGGFSILETEMFLFKEALRLCDASYFHLLSGQDYPTRPLDLFLSFFMNNYGYEFINYVHLPHHLWQNGTYSRFQYFYPYDFVKDSRNSKIVSVCVKIQHILGIKRTIPNHFDHIYGGNQWISITRNAIKYILIFSRKYPMFYYRMKMTFAPEEVYFQTLLCNVNKRQYILDNKRYIRWEMENGSNPANLCVKHLHYLLENDCLIARKFTQVISNRLCDIVDRYLINNESMFDSISDIFHNDYKRNSFNNHILNIVVDYIKIMGIKDGIDFGCGIGLYVYNLRMKGFPIIGYDNDKTIVDFSKILYNDDSICELGDISDDVEFRSTFGLSICFDVLPYLSSNQIDKVLLNLKKITNSSVIISLKKDFYNTILHQKIINYMQENEEFHNNVYFSTLLNNYDHSYNYYVFEKLSY